MKLTTSCCTCFEGLATDSRLKIVNLLQEKGKLSVLAVAAHFQLKQPTITHHLQYLRKSGIVSSKKEGRNVFYFINQRCHRGDCYVFN